MPVKWIDTGVKYFLFFARVRLKHIISAIDLIYRNVQSYMLKNAR